MLSPDYFPKGGQCGRIGGGAGDEENQYRTRRYAGFDEGDKPADWAESLRKRGIAVRLGVMREDAARVLKDYRRSGGEIYHPGPDPS